MTNNLIQHRRCHLCIDGVVYSHYHDGATPVDTESSCTHSSCVDGWVPYSKIDVTDIIDKLDALDSFLGVIETKIDAL